MYINSPKKNLVVEDIHRELTRMKKKKETLISIIG